MDTPPSRPATRRPAESATLPYRPDYDGLRGVAILAVVAYHAFPGALPGGFVGVDVFFVISGFLISSILMADFGAPSPQLGGVLADFYGRRVRRIFPALIVVLAACLALGYRLLVPSELTLLARQTIAGAAFYQNFLLAGQVGYFDPAAATTPLLHLWSLAVEEQFYLVWPLAIWLATRVRLRVLPVAVFLLAASFAWNEQKYPGTAAAAFFLPQMRLWELLVGAVVAALRPAGRPEPGGPTAWSQVRPATGVALIGAGFLAARDAPDAWTLLPAVGSALILSSHRAAAVNRFLSRRVLVWFGRLSYPLYLWHWPLLAFARIAGDGTDSIGQRAGIVSVAIVLAGLTERLLERPLRRQRPTRRLVGALLAALAAVAGAGLLTLRFGGFPGRFPPLVSAIGSFRYDGAAAMRQGTYFLIGDANESSFPRDPSEIVRGRPTLYLWGDSHAAALYPGLSQVDGARLNIVQRTAAKTPPFMPEAFNPGNARQINQYVFNAIVREQPEYVLLDAHWADYDWSRVESTIRALKGAGIAHVVLVGPVPDWPGSLPQQLFNYVRRHPGSPVPERLPLPGEADLRRLDRQLAKLSGRLGADYVSPCGILDGPGGFLIRTGDTPDALMTYDQTHLTARGSAYLVAHFPPGLLP